MSLLLERNTRPHGLVVKTYGMGPATLGLGNTVNIGDYEISLEDFLIAAHYVLTNTDLEEDDPRRKFMDAIRTMREVDGHNPGRKRLDSPEVFFL